jgi:predicted ribonuclease YlaK
MAGSGKTHQAIKTALNSKKQIIIIRNVVQVRDIGFLPGDIHEKTYLFFQLYNQIFKNAGSKTALETLKNKKKVVFETTSFLRGKTFDDCFVVVDECQNMTTQELETVLTRIGKNTDVIFVGDVDQADIHDSGWCDFHQIMISIKGVRHFHLNKQFRSDIITKYYERKIKMR